MVKVSKKISGVPVKSIRFENIHGANRNELIKTIEKIKIPVPPGSFKLHTTSAFIGSCNSGKTNAMINLAEEYQKFGSFNRIIIMSPTYYNNEAFQRLEVARGDVYSGSTVLKNGIGCVTEVEMKVKKAGEDYKDYEIYKEAYIAHLRGKANLNQMTLLENNLFEPPDFIPRPSILLIMDDLSHTGVFSVSKKNDFINLLLRHRHAHDIGLSIFMAVQNFNTGIPKILRQNCKQFFIWKTHDTTQADSIYEQVACGCTKEEFTTAFEEATKEPHNFLTVDLNSSAGSVFRKNFHEQILFE